MKNILRLYMSLLLYLVPALLNVCSWLHSGTPRWTWGIIYIVSYTWAVPAITNNVSIAWMSEREWVWGYLSVSVGPERDWRSLHSVTASCLMHVGISQLLWPWTGFVIQPTLSPCEKCANSRKKLKQKQKQCADIVTVYQSFALTEALTLGSGEVITNLPAH